MNLVYLADSRIPSREANSVHVMMMCQAFADLGHDVTLFAPGGIDRIEPGVADVFAFYGVRPNFSLQRVPWIDVTGRAFIHGYRAARQARRLVPKAAFGRSLHACAFSARMGIPTRWDAHMPDFLSRPHERHLFQWMIGAKPFRGVTTNSEALRRTILAAVPELEGKIVTLQNGANPIAEDATAIDLGSQEGRLQVGYVGQLYAGKGLELIRRVAALAPDMDFHIVGGNADVLARLAADASMAPNLRLHGFVPPRETERYLLAFDVVLAPYQQEVLTAGGAETAGWMSPLKLYAYMAAGRAILCSDLPVLHEIVEDGRTALLVPPDDAAAWVSALRRLAIDPEQRRRLGEAAQAAFLARHTWRKRAEGALAGLA